MHPLTQGVWALLARFVASRRGHQGNLYAIDRTPLAVGHQRRLAQPRVLAGRAARGKPSRAWFLGLKLPLVFNPQRPLVALKLTQANLSDTTAVPQLTKDLVGKRFADKGEIGKKLAEQLRRRGLALRTRGRRNMKAWPISRRDQALLNGGNSAATIIAHIQEFSSLRLPKHRLVFNPFTHITAAIVASQIDPWLPKPVPLLCHYQTRNSGYICCAICLFRSF